MRHACGAVVVDVYRYRIGVESYMISILAIVLSRRGLHDGEYSPGMFSLFVFLFPIISQDVFMFVIFMFIPHQAPSRRVIGSCGF